MSLFKKFVCIFCSVALIAMIAGCSANQVKQQNSTNPTDNTASAPNESEATNPAGTNSKVLVAYFSCTGTTKGIAESIANETRGTLYEIVPENPYSDADLNYSNSDSRATKEQNDSSVRPAINGAVEKMELYDIVFIGYPIWWGQAPRIINTFLENYDFSGKTIVPFCTSHSSGVGSSDKALHSLVSDSAVWKDGKRLSAGDDIAKWIKGLDLDFSTAASLPYDGFYPQHEPMGTGIGAMPGRVAWVYEPDCVNWTEGLWWEFDNFDYDLIQQMVDEGITATGGGGTPAESWDAMFRYHNGTRGKGSVGYTSGEIIAIKCNMNGAGWSGPNDEHTANAFTNPVALRALLVSLVEDAGVPPECITVYDASRNIPDYSAEYCCQGVADGVRFLGVDECEPDQNYPLKWSESFSGETSYLPTCVTEAEYLINFADLKGHSMNGITLTAKNHFGSFMNSSRASSVRYCRQYEQVHCACRLDGQLYAGGKDSTLSSGRNHCFTQRRLYNNGKRTKFDLAVRTV